MAKTKEELQRQLIAFKAELKIHEKKLAKAQKDRNNKDVVNYSMSVAGIKNSIREIETQLRKM
ncbi:hypothetical protein SEA_ENYGMA_120 [Streptomyces phage Enygma]